MGNENITIKNAQVVFIDENKHELWVNGTVPGSNGTLVTVKKVREGMFAGLQTVSTQSKEADAQKEESKRQLNKTYENICI